MATEDKLVRELFIAIKAQNYNKIVELVERENVSLNQRNEYGHTPLYYSFFCNKRISCYIAKKLKEEELKLKKEREDRVRYLNSLRLKHQKPTLNSEKLEDIISTRGDLNEDENIEEDINTIENFDSQPIPQIETLSSMFPEYPTSFFQELLMENQDDIQKVIEILLNENGTEEKQSMNFVNTELWPTLDAQTNQKGGSKSKSKTKSKQLKKNQSNENAQVIQDQENPKEKGITLNEVADIQMLGNTNISQYDDQWVSVHSEEEEEGEEEERDDESFDFGSIHGSQDSSIYLVEPDEWDVVSQTSEISFQSDLLEFEERDNLENEIEKEIENENENGNEKGQKTSYVEALKVNMVKKNFRVPTLVYPKYDQPLSASTPSENEQDDALKLQEQVSLLKDRPFGKATKEMKGKQVNKPPKVKRKKTKNF